MVVFERGNSDDDEARVVVVEAATELARLQAFFTLIYICQRPTSSYKCLHKTVVYFPALHNIQK